MRISDWGSDVCSSDLTLGPLPWRKCRTADSQLSLLSWRDHSPLFDALVPGKVSGRAGHRTLSCAAMFRLNCTKKLLDRIKPEIVEPGPSDTALGSWYATALLWKPTRSDEGRVGKECVSTVRSRRAPDN